MRIGELARKTGVPTKTIRYYEEIGVLPSPERAANGYRSYGWAAVERLLFVRDARATGLSLTEIGSILSLRDQGESTCNHVLGLLEAHLEEIDAHIESLQKTRRQLATLTKRARGLDSADCTDPNRCQAIIESGAMPTRRGGGTRHVHEAPHAHGHS
jgi:DNA-binding transcriptional MerR regulator